MTFAGWAQLIALIVLIGVTAPLLGRYMANVYEGGPSRLDRVFGPIERFFYRACRIDPEREQRWNIYALSLIAFSIVGFVILYVMQRVQSGLPFNPTDMANVQPALSLNTAVSFVTNTNWQSYAGESTMSHLTQMVGLTVQNFVSAAAVGMAVFAALIRGLSRAGKHHRELLGRPRAHDVADPAPDRVRLRDRRSSRAAIQNTHGFTTVHTVAGATQKIPGGPVASQESIKMLGTNGGGFFNTNSAHPFENPTKLSDFLELYAILIIPFALAFTFGRMVKDKRQGYAVFAVMFVLWLAFSMVAIFAEVGGNPKLDSRGVSQAVTANSPGGNRRRQGNAVRPRRVGRLRFVDDGHVDRLGQLHDRQLHAGRRHGAAREHEARRDQALAAWVGTGLNRPSDPSSSCPCSSPASWWAARRSTWEEDPGRRGEAGRRSTS